jgi:cytoskeletal protein CcmA (bactofilin family)
MALFSNNEPEKSVHPEQSARLHPDTAPAAPPITLPAQKIVEPPATAAARLDRGTKISGKLHFEGPARIDGDIDGEIDGKEITIGESAAVTAQIRAESIVVCGKVKGEITATQRIEIHPTATIIGNITAPKLIVQDGAIFEGHCSMGHEPDAITRSARHRNGVSTDDRTRA